MIEPLFISNDLNRHKLISLIVVALERLPEAALPQRLQHLVPVTQVVLHHHVVVAPLVVETVVVS